VSGETTGARRGTLSRALIVQEAVLFVDEISVSQLSMRKLGQRLGVEAMSLYRYVDGREDLLDAIVSSVTERLESDPDLRLRPGDGWQHYLQRLAHAVRDIALEHPKAFPLIATRHPAAPWLRPPLRSLPVVEAFLEALLQSGFHDEAAVAAYRAFSSFLLGHLLLEVSALGATSTSGSEPLAEATVEHDQPEGRPQAKHDDDDPSSVETLRSEVDISEFAELSRLKDKLSADRSAEEFEESLESLLQRIELTMTY
jgi:AcrR family transcriptional regulator